jgi:hypothetical protein
MTGADIVGEREKERLRQAFPEVDTDGTGALNGLPGRQRRSGR